MTVCRKRIASRSQLHMEGTLHYHLVARSNTTQNLYFLAVAGTELHFLLLVAFLALLDVYKVQALFLGECFYRESDGVFHVLREEIDFYERARDDVTLVVEAEGYRYIERTG